MTAALTVQENGHGADLITFDDSKVGLIKRTIAQDATDDELALFLHQAQRTGLDPLARQIYFQKYKTKNGPQIAIITGIDGYRLVAVRTGLYAGNDAPEFEGRINYQGNDVPAKASVTVYRIVGNRRCAFTSSVYWNEYCPNPPKDYQWKKMPHVMLAKCAEAAALRKAFPADLSGVYTREEMGQADWFDDNQSTFDQPDPLSDDDFNQDVEQSIKEIDRKHDESPDYDKDGKLIDSAYMAVMDTRASLEEYQRMTGIQVADAAIQTGHYNSREHVEATLKKHHEGFRKSGGKLSAGVDRAIALEWFDALMQHSETTDAA